MNSQDCALLAAPVPGHSTQQQHCPPFADQPGSELQGGRGGGREGVGGGDGERGGGREGGGGGQRDRGRKI